MGVASCPVSAEEPAGGSFIVNSISGRCIDVSPDLANLQSLDCDWQNPDTDQRWVLRPDGFIDNAFNTGSCIDVLGSPGMENNAPLQQSLCEWQDPNTDQRWQMTAEGFIVNLLSGRCIDVSVDLVQLVLFDCEWGVQGDQAWFLS